MADYLASIAFSGAGTIIFQSFQEFSNVDKTLINQDKAQNRVLHHFLRMETCTDSRCLGIVWHHYHKVLIVLDNYLSI